MSDADPPLLKQPRKDDIEAIRASRLFDAKWYQETYPDVEALGMDPAEHYLWLGVHLERRPSKDFDPARYLRLNGEVAAAGLNPLLHYERAREKGTRAPNAEIVECGVPNHGEGIEAIRVVQTTPAPAIIVPIYNAPECVEDCIRSVLHHTNQDFRLILVDDASPDRRVQDLLWRFAGLPNVTVAGNASNLGYTATVNRGIALAGNADVVLLNSDTVVTPLWLRNLQLAAYSGDRVATATPFSDNAGAFSAPRIGEPNAIPEQTGLDAYARLVTRNAARLYPEVPTGNGFCMYVRRACIDEIGAFDAEAFPRGYGEENDFCLRAAAAGWTHVVDDATLIHHVRSASFGPENETLRQAGRTAVDQRHPAYPKAVAAMLADPLLDRARRNVNVALQKAASGSRVLPRILFVISTTSGGTPRTNEDLMKALDDRAEAFVLRCDSRVIQLFEVSGGDCVQVARHDLKTPTRAFPHRSEEYDAVLRTWLVRYAFESVHIRHIAWHSLGLVDEARLLGLPVVFSFHDYYTVCPTVKLLDDQMAFCGGRCTPGAGRCQMELWDTDTYPGLKHGAVYDWRKQFFDALSKCSAFVTTSTAVRNGIIDAFPALRDRRFEIIPHGRDFSRFDQPEPSWQDHESLRLLVPGHILPAKGREIVAELGRRAAELKLELHILGTIDPAVEATANVVLHGSYDRDEFRDRVEQIKPHVAGIFSIWPETFCHTLTELWACGIPVVAFDIGAVADRIRVHGGGWLCDVGDLNGLSHRILDIRQDRAGYSRKLEDVRRWQVAEGRVHTSRWMAERYWEIYSTLAPGLSTAPDASALVIEAAMRRLDGPKAVAVAPDDTIEARPDARQMPSAAHWRAYAQAVLSPATRGSVFGRKLLAILQADAPFGISEALMASEAALERASARMAKKRHQPLVSIVMPTHNRADVIDEAIQSVVDQDYGNWQLFVCDDASTDDTEGVVAGFHDDRIHHLKLPKGGAAAARNAGLAQARGDIIAYLDSDNCWHPRFLSRMVLVLLDRPGHSAVYGNFIDYKVDETSGTSIKSFVRPPFDQEQLLHKNYIDLNTFVHRRELYDCFGGFNETLTRRQDYDLIIKYTWLRDPVRTKDIVALYQRNPTLRQITTEAGHDDSCVRIIDDSISQYLASGLPTVGARQKQRVTILSWDLCRNHFSKPFALAEALSQSLDVQLVSFRFFDEEIFPPLKDVSPRFETVYLPGPQFPDFFEAMDKAVEAIDGDVIYVVKPRLPSLGTALLANARRGTPIILEINDLETVVASPTARDRHRETAFDSVDLADAELLNPYSDTWSHIMDPIAKTLPVLATHNKFIDAHFGHRCLYMRNLKDEAVYDPALYDREAMRAELGFSPDDRIILFGGMVRRHKGVYELIDLVERLGDARYKLLFVGSRETPDQRQLVERFGDRVRVLPPQDRAAMARINLAADLVILWLDPDVPASHAQMPYKATDALAMKTPIIANDISDLGDLGRQGYLRLVPFGDWEAMARTIEELFSDEAGTAAMREAGRRLYQRQFSYAAARADFALMLHRVQALDAGPLPAASAFARRFDEFRRTVTGASAPAAPSQRPAPGRLKIDGHGDMPEDASIVALDVTALDRLSHLDPEGVGVVMPSIDTARALATARLLVRRAGLQTTVFVVEDTLRQGFIRTLNATAARLTVKYIVYLAEDAFPGVDWLKIAHDALEHSGKGLLAFNDGKWKGRIAAFGLVRTEWVRKLYGGPVFHPGYEAHKADNELTAIARAQDMFVYQSAAALFEHDRNKVFADKAAKDPGLFRERFRNGFDGVVELDKLAPLALEYRVPLDTGASPNLTELHASPVHFPEVSKGFDAEWEIVDAADGNSRFRSHDGIVVLMYAQDPDKGAVTAEKLARRAGADCKIIVVLDTRNEGMVAAINRVSAPLGASYLVYLTQDAFAGLNWLHEALEAMRASDKSLLGFNDGSGDSYILKFVMVRTQWVRQLYGSHLFCPRYRSAVALAELSAIAHASQIHAHAPDAVMFEHGHAGTNQTTADDWRTFQERLKEGFDGLIPVQERKTWASRFLSLGRKPEDVALRAKAVQPAPISTAFSNLRAPALEAEVRDWKSGKDAALTSTVTTLVAAAEEAIARGPYSVIDKTSLPPSGNRNDYWHPAPYWWPNPDTPDGLPYINRDGRRVPGTRLYEPDSDKYDRSRLQRVFDDSFVLSLAWKFTGRQDFIDHAAHILKRFFLDPETRMTPHLSYAQVRMGHDGNAGSKSGIIEMKDLYYYLDAVRIMVQADALGDHALNRFEAWLDEYLDWLLTSPQGKQECKSPNNHGIYYDLQVSSIAAFRNRQDVLSEALARARSRIDQHFEADGSQPRELRRNTSAHYCCFNLQGWINLAALAVHSDVDLWWCRGENGAGPADGARWLLAHMGKPWPYEQIDEFDTDRFLPVLFALPPADIDALRIPGLPKSKYHAKPCFFPHDGIRPFWNLAAATTSGQSSSPLQTDQQQALKDEAR